MAAILHAVPLAGVCRKERSSPVPQVRARPEEMCGVWGASAPRSWRTVGPRHASRRFHREILGSRPLKEIALCTV